MGVSTLPGWLHSLSAQTVERELDAGMASERRLDVGGALRSYQAAIAHDSASAPAKWHAALAASTLAELDDTRGDKRGRDSLYGLAVAYARRAVAADPASADAWFSLGLSLGKNALTQSKRDQVKTAGEVRTAALKALDLNPRHDGAHHTLGRWNAEIKRLSGLSRFLAKTFLGGSVFNEATWDGAVQHLEQAVSLDSTRIYHHLDLALVYLDRDRNDDAARQLATALRLPVKYALDSVYQARAQAALARLRRP